MTITDEQVRAAFTQQLHETAEILMRQANIETGYVRHQVAHFANLMESAAREIDAMRAALATMPERPETGWIKCSERMPEYGVRIIVSDGSRVKESFLDDGKYLRKPKDRWQQPGGGNLYFTPTVWQPLPAPPQEDKP